MWMQREIAMNLQVVETIHLGALFANRKLMEELLEGVARHAGESRVNWLTLYTVDRYGDEWRMADLLQRTPPRLLILIENIDAFFNAREKQDTRIQISFSGLLNAIDGVGAQEGRVVVTTNHRELLDAALIHPGHIDLKIKLGNATPLQLKGLLLRFYPDAVERIDHLVADYPARLLSPAQIQQVLIAADSLDEAEAALREYVASVSAGRR